MKLWKIIPSVLLCMGCSEVPDATWDAGIDRAAIEGFMDEQQVAWNQGNVDEFMQHYWKSDSLTFIGRRGLTFGWDSTLHNYKRSYPNAAAMGRLRFTNDRVEILDTSNAFVIGRWELFRETDTLGGYYSLLWKKVDGRWCIVADHSS